MATHREKELLIRRQQLIDRSAQLRSALVVQAAGLQPRSLLAGGAGTGLKWAQAHSGWLIGGLVMLVVLRPSRAWRWGGRLIGAWHLVKRVQPVWAALSARRA